MHIISELLKEECITDRYQKCIDYNAHDKI